MEETFSFEDTTFVKRKKPFPFQLAWSLFLGVGYLAFGFILFFETDKVLAFFNSTTRLVAYVTPSFTQYVGMEIPANSEYFFTAQAVILMGSLGLLSFLSLMPGAKNVLAILHIFIKLMAAIIFGIYFQKYHQTAFFMAILAESLLLLLSIMFLSVDWVKNFSFYNKPKDQSPG